MTSDLVKRLRGGTENLLRAIVWMREAADRIEELERERDKAVATLKRYKIADRELMKLSPQMRARREALEEAAQEIERRHTLRVGDDLIVSKGTQGDAAAIRKLMEKKDE